MPSKWIKESLNYDEPAVCLAIEGEMARELVVRWGSVAAVPDGEDSAGRSQVRLQTPEELVDRAIRTAQYLCEALDDNGWIKWIKRDKSALPKYGKTEVVEKTTES